MDIYKLINDKTIKYKINAFVLTYKNSNLPIIQWLVENIQVILHSDCSNHAFGCHENMGNFINPDLSQSEHGHLHIAQLLLEERNQTQQNQVIHI